MSQRKTKHGIIGTNVRAYKKSGNQPWAFSFNRQAPEVPAVCPRCGQRHYVHSPDQLDAQGVSAQQCHGCDVEDTDARKADDIANAVGKYFTTPADTVRFAYKGKGVTAARKNGPWEDLTRTEFIAPGTYKIVSHEGRGDTSVYVVTKGPGERFLKVQAVNAFRRLEESLSSDAAFTDSSFTWADLKGENRRFMFDGRRMLIGMKGGTPTKGSHATEWRDATGGNAGFDDSVRGWLGISGRFKHGVIHFAPPIVGASFDRGWDCLAWFKKNGATDKTLVRGFPGKWEQSLADAMSGALAESRLSQVEYDVARLKGADAEKVRDMLAAGFASTRVAKDMPRPSGSWAWFEIFDVRDGLDSPRIPGVVFYAPVGLTASQFGSAAKKALMRALSESVTESRAPRPSDGYWYHSTKLANAKKIAAVGLKTGYARQLAKTYGDAEPGAEVNGDLVVQQAASMQTNKFSSKFNRESVGRIYFSNARELGSDYYGDIIAKRHQENTGKALKMVTLRVSHDDVKMQLDIASTDDGYVTSTVPPSKIQMLRDGEWVPIKSLLESITERIDRTLASLGESQEPVEVRFEDRAFLLNVRKPGDTKWRYVGPSGKATSKPQAMTLFGDDAHTRLKTAREKNPSLEFALEQGAAEWTLWGRYRDGSVGPDWMRVNTGSISAMKADARKRLGSMECVVTPKGLHPDR